jgi:hypothetical protein
MTSARAIRAPRGEALAWRLLAAAAILAGAFLRWYQLGIQVVLDDEWHALNKLLASDYAGIATSFGYADHSIPLTLYYRFLLLHGGLTEWVMHAPMLIAGIGLLVAAPLLLRRETSLPVRGTWVALLAISPLLVYHSRTARPYALTSLATFVAIVAFRRWWAGERGATGWGATYVLSTFFAGYLHVTTLPFTLLPFVYYGLGSLATVRGNLKRWWPSLCRLVLLGIVAAILLAAALAPPLVHDWMALSSKTSAGAVSLESVYRTTLLLYGIAHPAAPVVLVVLVLLTGYGAVRCWSRDRELAGYLSAVTLGGVLAIGLAGPLMIDHPLVLARYALPALPFLLLFFAEGVAGCLERLPVAPLRAAIATLLTALLWWLGPMPDYLYYPNQFMGHLRFQYDYDPAKNPYVQFVPREPVPEFYRALAQRPVASLTLIEAPWRIESHFNPLSLYQEVHRQLVKVGLVTPVCGVRDYGEYPATVMGLRLHQFAHLSNVLEGKTYGADYLVIHLASWRTPPESKVEWPDVASCLPAIERALGAPVYRDGQIVVFDLKAPRPALPADESPSAGTATEAARATPR